MGRLMSRRTVLCHEDVSKTKRCQRVYSVCEGLDYRCQAYSFRCCHFNSGRNFGSKSTSLSGVLVVDGDEIVKYCPQLLIFLTLCVSYS